MSAAVLVVVTVTIAPARFPMPVAIDPVAMIVVVRTMVPRDNDASGAREDQQGGDGAERR